MTIIFYLFLTLTVSYCCGNLNGAIIASTMLHHSDVRERGSGNAGLTNFYRCYGSGATFLVILIDIVKAAAAVCAGKLIMTACGLPELGQGAGMLGVMLGHMFPATYQFRGGKGVLAVYSGLMVIDWRMGLVLLAVFIIVVVLTRYISLGSLLCAFLTPFGLYLCTGSLTLTAFGAVCGGIIIFKHRANIRRLCAGEESRFSFQKKNQG